MDASDICEHSVFDLISKLAALLLQDERAETEKTYAKNAFVPKPTDVSKKRAQIYESLLHIPVFQLCPKLDRFPRCRKLLEDEGNHFDEKLITDITYCVVKVSNPPPITKSLCQYFQSHGVGGRYKCRLLRPKPMGLEVAPRNRKLHDSIFTPPTFFKSIKDMNGQLEPVKFTRKTNVVLSDIKKLQQQSNNIRAPAPKLISSTLKDSLARIREFTVSTEPLKTRFPLPPKWREDAKRDEQRKGYQRKRKGEQRKREHKKRDHEKAAKFKKPTPKQKTDKTGKFHDKYFFADVCMTNEVRWHQNKKVALSFIELADFIDHLKKASVGLQSETFLWTEAGHFQLRANSTVKTVLPEVLADYSQPFLETGCAYRRLIAHTEWYYAENRVERPMNRTMRQAIIEFLANSRLFLLSQPATNLSQLLHSASPTMQILLQLDRMFQTEQRLNIGLGTSGACLLKVIWSAIDVCVNIQYLQFLMYLLKSLCETYCGQLQRWLYHGELAEDFNEIFVGTQRCLDAQSKEFFDKGYFVRSHMVPGFLAGFEIAIVQCGKYSRLLKSYNPEHILFHTKHPELLVCLSQSQLTEMQQRLELHYKQLLLKIKPFRMQSMIEERSASRYRFGDRMWSCTQERIADWKLNKRELLLKANEGKLQRYEELNKQRKEQQQLRLEQRRTEIAAEFAFQLKCNEQEEERLRRDKQEMEERIAVYQKIVNPLNKSPDESTNSTHSFTSCCEELEAELTTKDLLNTQKKNLAKVPPQLEPNEVKVEQMNSVETEQNANDADMEMVRNRKHNMRSEQFQECQTEVRLKMDEMEETQPEQNANDADLEMGRNRKHNMCSEQFQECQTEVRLKMQTTTATVNALTDLECNRLRVLGCTDMQPQLPIDVNMNLEDLSDMQRNRHRMQQHEHFGSFSETKRRSKSLEIQTKTKKSPLNNVGLSVDLQLPLEPHKLFVEPIGALDTVTPMSTTSDVEIETLIPNETVDAVNNNVKQNVREPLKKPLEKLSLTLPDSPAFQLRKPDAPVFQLQRPAAVAACHKQQPERSDHNAFLIKRYVQQSIMVPLRTHLSLLRNEVLRVFDDLNVFEHFSQLRNYFFLLDGEFGTMLINGILQRIEAGMEPSRLCRSGTLDAILNNALGNKAADSLDPTTALIAENLKLSFTIVPESFDLMDINVLSIFTLIYKVNWPLNLVISAETINKYGEIFTHLLKLRHVNFMLERAYQHLQEMGKLHGKPLQSSAQYRHLQMIRHKLSHFVITLQNHLDTNALQGIWQTFNEKLRNVDSVEELYQRHVEYLKHIAFISLLNRRSTKFRETIDNILVIVLRFCKILHSKPFDLDQNQEFFHPRYKRLVFEETEFEKFLYYVIYLGEKVDASGYQDKIVELIRIINFNSYYNVTNSTNQAK